MSYDLISSRHCNICLILQEEQDNWTSENAHILLKCSGCQLQYYCGVAHQRIDWPLHRDLCRATRRIKAAYKVRHPLYLNGKPREARDLQVTIFQLKYLLRFTLGRQLEFYEEELTSFPAYCALCYSLKNLQHCSGCQAVSYCSVTHSRADLERHNRNCNLLKLYYCTFKTQKMLADNKITKYFYESVPEMHNSNLKNIFHKMTHLILPTNPMSSLEAYQLYAFAADFSCITTTCYALEVVDVPQLKTNTLVIFIVGATIESRLWFLNQHTRFFFLHNPQIKQLELYFIGPEIIFNEEKPDNYQDVYQFKGCERTVVYNIYYGLFQDFMQQCKIKPSLIICFNCGFSEHLLIGTKTSVLEIPQLILDSLMNTNSAPSATTLLREDRDKDTWQEGIFEMLHVFNVPIVFTSFTMEEAEFDYAAVMGANKTEELISVEHILHIKQNPFKDFRPLRNWNIEETEEIYYRNSYIQAVRTKFLK